MVQLCHHIIIFRTDTGLQNQCALPGFTLSSLAFSELYTQYLGPEPHSRRCREAQLRTAVSSGDERWRAKDLYAGWLLCDGEEYEGLGECPGSALHGQLFLLQLVLRKYGFTCSIPDAPRGQPE